MILILRGHIRNSFDNNDLCKLVHLIKQEVGELIIYIHTWNIKANNQSWRNIPVNLTTVTKEMIYSYFYQSPELIGSIKGIIIDDDSRIQLIGNIAGRVCKSGMPMHGWKKYWYGKYRVANQVFEEIKDKTQVVLNCRLDVLNNSNPIHASKIIGFAKTYFDKNRQHINFIDNRVMGIDNIYFGTVQLNYRLAHTFYTQLDTICAQNQMVANQEKLVFIISCQLNASATHQSTIVNEPTKPETVMSESIQNVHQQLNSIISKYTTPIDTHKTPIKPLNEYIKQKIERRELSHKLQHMKLTNKPKPAFKPK